MSVSCLPLFLSTALSSLLSFLDARIRERTLSIFLGLLLAQDKRRTASKWFRAAGIGSEYKLAYRHIASVGREARVIGDAALRMIARHPASQGAKDLFALDDTLTKRYGPLVEGAGLHRNPTPGPSQHPFAYGHNFVAAAQIVHHSEHGTIALPFRADLYIRQKDVAKLPPWYHWKFRTKLDMAVAILGEIAITRHPGAKPVWIAVDGGYAKKPVLEACRKHNFHLVGRLRHDAALFDVPKSPKTKGRGRPRKYGEKRIELAKRAAHAKAWTTETMTLYGQEQVKTYKSFLATWRPAGGVIRVVLVKEDKGWLAFFSTDLEATVAEILEAVADRNALEQTFKDVKEVWGAGQQQLRNLHANVGAFHMNLWMMTLVELWAWDKSEEQLVDRSDRPWDNKPRRPSHNDRRKSLVRQVLREEFQSFPSKGPGSRLFRRVCERLLALAL